MEIDSVKLVYFSPTGTTKAVAHGIAHGINPDRVESIDITKPDARTKPMQTSESELLVVAVPVYMGRVPALVTEWLDSIKALGTPTVCVVVYGNRVYDDALLELKNIISNCGGMTIACAAYVGEHSFSNDETPIAHGRPNEDDLRHAEAFGRDIRNKLQSISAASELTDIAVPGNYPYGGVTKLWDVDFIAVSDACTQCGVCSSVCPVDAIDPHRSELIDQEKCITCCACIKKCPQRARTIKNSPVKDASKRLNEFFSEPKHPEFFL